MYKYNIMVGKILYQHAEGKIHQLKGMEMVADTPKKYRPTIMLLTTYIHTTL